MNNIYDKNMALLERSFPQMYKAYTNTPAEEKSNVYVEQDFAAVVTDREWYFTSRYNQDEVAAIWAEQFSDKPDHIFVMVGLGNATYLKALKKHIHESSVVLVYEPEREIFEQCVRKVDLTELLVKNTGLAVEDINKGQMYEYFIALIDYANRNKVHFVIHPNYDKVYFQQAKWLKEILDNEILLMEYTKNTSKRFSQEFFDNMLNNLWSYMSNSSINKLRAAFVEKKCNDVPAVIVAAGSSLNKNMELLKDYKGKVFIIACDSALNPLLKNGIVPDIALTLDPHKPLSLFSMPQVKTLPFVLCIQAVTWMSKEHQGPKFYFAENALTTNIMKKYSREMETLETAGSVANNAFSLARYLGYKKIILIGQDLAFADDGNYYAGGVHDNQKVGAIKDTTRYYYVDGYYGGTVRTTENLDLYRTWFEKQILRYKDMEVIDATQGGAMIHGATNMDLCDALADCTKEYDFASIIEGVDNVFSEEELAGVREDFMKFEQVLTQIISDIDAGVKDYNKLRDLLVKGKQGSKEFSRIFERTQELQKRIDEEPLMELAAMHNRDVEYEVLDDVTQEGSSVYAEGLTAINSGIKLLESYKYGAQKTIEGLPILYSTM